MVARNGASRQRKVSPSQIAEALVRKDDAESTIGKADCRNSVILLSARDSGRTRQDLRAPPGLCVDTDAVA